MYEKTTTTTVLTVLKGMEVQTALKESFGVEVPTKQPGEKRLPAMVLQLEFDAAQLRKAGLKPEPGWLETEKDQTVAFIPLPTREDKDPELRLQSKDTLKEEKIQFWSKASSDDTALLLESAILIPERVYYQPGLVILAMTYPTTPVKDSGLAEHGGANQNIS